LTSNLSTPRGATILAGESFTVEATRVAKAGGRDVIAVHE
jgi:hypothetical protein